MNRHVVIWRHADAGDPSSSWDADFARPLSARGRAQASQMARWLTARLPVPVQVLSSQAPRARQTASALASSPKVDARLSPGSTLRAYVEILDEALEASSDTIVLVGHQPLAGALAGHLLGAGEARLAVGTAGVWWLTSRDGRGIWRVDAVMHPHLLLPAER